MSMVKYFFSNKYANSEYLFDGLTISEDKEMMALQGTYPVINLTFSSIKESIYNHAIRRIKKIISGLFEDYRYILDGAAFSDTEKIDYVNICARKADDLEYVDSLNMLSKYLFKYYNKKVIIILDEYDTPLQEAYVNGYGDEMTSFIRGMFNATFKANEYLERGLLIGITRVSNESIFSDFNNLNVVTISSKQYADCFGFTQEEVDDALSYYGLMDKRDEVEKWYNGFIFGKSTIIYNPWSMINYLKNGEFGAYWANTSSNSLINKLMRQGDKDTKLKLQALMQGDSICVKVDEQVVFNNPDNNRQAVWSLLVVTGYLKILDYDYSSNYILKLTIFEVKLMFENMISGWFMETEYYNDFIQALMEDNLKEMNKYRVNHFFRGIATT